MGIGSQQYPTPGEREEAAETAKDFMESEDYRTLMEPVKGDMFILSGYCYPRFPSIRWFKRFINLMKIKIWKWGRKTNAVLDNILR